MRFGLRPVLCVFLCVLLAAVSGCGGGPAQSDDDPTEPPGTEERDDPTESDTEERAETTEPEGVDTLENVRSATVKIVSQGTFVDPAVGTMYNEAGVGTGFIIDPSGVAVTNNHVVTGAATLEVFVEGRDAAVNATILGVSECADLAVIDLAGDGYEYLAFGDADDVKEGLEVYAAGYPLTSERSVTDVDYTLTRGIVSSTRADGETGWASVDGVLEHDARIRGGNSGGPLVDAAGRVVGVNYAGIDDADQSFAIGLGVAVPVIELLQRGENVDSIGINGQAVLDDASGLNGVWVASVDSGSPASNVGIRAGDLVVSLEGLVLATDGTMSDYCDVLRTRGAEAVSQVEVYRYDTDEILEGEINGRELEPVTRLANEIEADFEEGEEVTAGGTYGDYVLVVDDSEAVGVEVPVEWSDTNGEENPTFGPSIWAAPDLEAFVETWDVPGVVVEVSDQSGSDSVAATLDELSPSGACTSEGREPYDDGLYAGEFEVWADCGGTSTLLVTVAAAPPDDRFLIRVAAQVVEDRDLDALDRIIASFYAEL
jgi:serine protease Do